jgi:hypothetical protein
MLILDPAFLAGVRIPTIKLGEPNFPKAQLASFEPNGVGNILTRWGARRLEVARDRRSINQRLVEFIVPLTMLECLLTVHRPDPLAISGLLDVLGLLGIHAAVEAHISVPLANARYRG